MAASVPGSGFCSARCCRCCLQRWCCLVGMIQLPAGSRRIPDPVPWQVYLVMSEPDLGDGFILPTWTSAGRRSSKIADMARSTAPGPESTLPGTYSLRSASVSKVPSASGVGKSCPTVTVNRPQIFPRAFVAVADHVPSSVVPGAARGSRCTMSRATLLRGLRGTGSYLTSTE